MLFLVNGINMQNFWYGPLIIYGSMSGANLLEIEYYYNYSYSWNPFNSRIPVHNRDKWKVLFFLTGRNLMWFTVWGSTVIDLTLKWADPWLRWTNLSLLSICLCCPPQQSVIIMQIFSDFYSRYVSGTIKCHRK